MSAPVTAYCEPTEDGGASATVVVDLGAGAARLSQREALRLWVLLGAATMPDAERAGAPSPEWVDAAVELLSEPSPVTFAGTVDATAVPAVPTAVPCDGELAAIRDALAYVGAAGDREVCLYGVWVRASRCGTRDYAAAERIARAFHEAYERLAPEHGYETRRASAVPWPEVPAHNRALMVATVRALLDAGTITAAHTTARTTSGSDR